MAMVLTRVDAELAEHGVCWMCKQGFSGEEIYYEVGLPNDDGYLVVEATCLGCGIQLALAEKTGGEPG